MKVRDLLEFITKYNVDLDADIELEMINSIDENDMCGEMTLNGFVGGLGYKTEADTTDWLDEDNPKIEVEISRVFKIAGEGKLTQH